VSQNLEIDNFRFYEFPIDQADITALYNEKNTSSCANIVNIPDANFKTALLEHGTTITGAGISPIDTDGDGEICETEAQVYTGNIQIPSQGISDLTGIEAFTALTVLNCSSNQLTNLDVSANTALLTLNCTFNQLISLNVANGNNNNMTMMTAFNNPNLTCIQHDTGYTPTPWVQGQGWLKDATASWSENCSTSVGIEDFEPSMIVSIYPNPFNNIVMFSLNDFYKKINITVRDITGKVVLEKIENLTNTQFSLDLSDHSAGVYFVQIGSEKSHIETIKLIKE
jgi:Leucine-rich repeat (LRR) protein